MTRESSLRTRNAVWRLTIASSMPVLHTAVCPASSAAGSSIAADSIPRVSAYVRMLDDLIPGCYDDAMLPRALIQRDPVNWGLRGVAICLSPRTSGWDFWPKLQANAKFSRHQTIASATSTEIMDLRAVGFGEVGRMLFSWAS